MKVVKTLLFASILVIFCVSFAVEARAAKVQLSLSFDKEQYSKSDGINVTFTLKNKSRSPIYVNSRFGVNAKDAPKNQREIYFEITNPKGERLTFKHDFGTGFPKTDDFVLLAPKEETSSKRPRNIKGLYDFKDAGTYKIIAVYENTYGREIGLDVFKGPVKSKAKTIKIIENK